MAALPVAGILLAAGRGARFGGPKALAEFRGKRLADRGVALLREGGAEPVIVVTGAAEIAVAGATSVHNPGWREGMGSSLRVALGAMPAAAGAAVIALVDQPLIGPESVRRLIAAHRAGAAVAVAAYHGLPRNPVLLAREHWAEVADLAVGDQGVRAFLRTHPELVSLVECGDTGDPADADTTDDLAALARGDTVFPGGHPRTPDGPRPPR
jgi:CTP:molybdopterin cytidylyltransferase MocA